MYKILTLLLLLILYGCGSVLTAPFTEPPQAKGDELAHVSSINDLSLYMASELVRQGGKLDPAQPLLVTTPVMLHDFEQTNELGLQYQQGLITALHAKQFHLVDINVAQTLRITPEGDFMLSRDWQQLPTDLAVRYVVISTMSVSQLGLVLYSRIVDVSSHEVLSVAQRFVSTTAMADLLKPSEKVMSKNGLLHRASTVGQHTATFVGESNESQ